MIGLRTFLTDGAATTNVAGGLTDEATTFVAGQVKDAGNTHGRDHARRRRSSPRSSSPSRPPPAPTPGAYYCFRLYDATSSAPLDGYAVYAQASLPDADARQPPVRPGRRPVRDRDARDRDALPVPADRAGTVTVDTLRVRFTTGGGVANGDVTRGRAVGGHERQRHLRRRRPRHAAAGRRRAGGRRAHVHDATSARHDRHELLRARHGREPRRRRHDDVLARGRRHRRGRGGGRRAGRDLERHPHRRTLPAAGRRRLLLGRDLGGRPQDRRADDHDLERHRHAQRGPDGLRRRGRRDHVQRRDQGLHQGRPQPERVRRAHRDGRPAPDVGRADRQRDHAGV